jgi:hypothetical protein
MAGLLCVPLLFQRCPSLRPVAVRLVRLAVAGLHAKPAGELAAWLPDLGPGGKAEAVAALLGNLVEAAPTALSSAAEGAVLGRARAVQFTSLAARLLSLLPLQPFFPEAHDWDGELPDCSHSGHMPDCDVDLPICGGAFVL